MPCGCKQQNNTALRPEVILERSQAAGTNTTTTASREVTQHAEAPIVSKEYLGLAFGGRQAGGACAIGRVRRSGLTKHNAEHEHDHQRDCDHEAHTAHAGHSAENAQHSTPSSTRTRHQDTQDQDHGSGTRSVPLCRRSTRTAVRAASGPQRATQSPLRHAQSTTTRSARSSQVRERMPTHETGRLLIEE